jgi:preprotein translocase subunit Sss1
MCQHANCRKPPFNTWDKVVLATGLACTVLGIIGLIHG